MANRFSFMSLVCVFGEKKLYELIEFLPDSFLDYKVRYVGEQELVRLYNDPEVTKDFYLENGYLGWSGETLEVDEKIYQDFLGKEMHVTSPNDHIYRWLLRMVELDARYLSDDAYSYLKENKSLPEFGTSKMSLLSVSKSTMRVYLKVLTEEGWRVHTLVGNDRGLYFEPFIFMLESSKVPQLGKSKSINFIEEVELGITNYSVFRVEDGLSLYPGFEPSFRLAGPMLNHLVFQVEKSKAASNFLWYFIKSTERTLFGYEEPEKKDPDTVYSATTDKSGVFFRYLTKAPKVSEHRDMLKAVSDVFEKLMKKEWGSKEVAPYFKKLGYGVLHQYACLTLLMVLAGTPPKALEKVDAAKLAKRDIDVECLKWELELFAVRSYVFVTDFKFPEYSSNLILEGGTSAVSTEIRKVGTGGIL